MGWIALTLRVPGSRAEALSDALLELGALSASVEDARAGSPDEQAIYGEPGEPAAQSWDDSVVSALLEGDADAEALLRAASEAAGLRELPAFRVEPVPEQDWVRLTQAQFEPIQVSPRLWVVPTWHQPPDPAAVNLSIDPGVAFGTGSHPTTRLCLAWLDAHIRGGETVLDYGCGSGILAVAALRLGAARAVGVDIDPQAPAAARHNAEVNGVAGRFTVEAGVADGSADVVVANILANPLRLLAPVLARAARPGGALVLSGILEEQAADVAQAYEPWCTMTISGSLDGWVCLAGTKR